MVMIKERMENYGVQGISIASIKEGELDSVQHYGLLENGTSKTVNDESIFNACSISKFVTAVLALKLVEDGYLNLDENVNTRLKTWQVPQNKFTQSSSVTLRKLLCHQGGFIDPKDSFGLLEDSSIPSMLALLEGRSAYFPSPLEVSYVPGTEFHYSDAGFCLIQHLIEDVMGDSFEHLMDTLLFRPLQMDNSTFNPIILTERNINVSSGHHKDGQVVLGNYPIYPYPAAAGLWSTPSDLAKLMIELISTLKGPNKLGIALELVQAMFSPQGCADWSGLGVFLDNTKSSLELSSLGWGAGFQSAIVAFPESESGIVIMTNTDLGVHQTKGLIGEIIKSPMLEKV
jgi:CubicO group peptidase (beta-lactamase class C family)